jgi:transcription antitermination protein NusB
MSKRHDSRKILMQSMYELDMNGLLLSGYDVLKESIDRVISILYSDSAFALAENDKNFLNELSKAVYERISILDDIIVKAAPEWPLEKISTVDRNILRIGLCELIFHEKLNVPPKVAIDEAIEIAKEFGGESSGKFVNGVLGSVYKELGEPGKKDRSANVPDIVKKNITQNKSGAMIYSIHNNKAYLAMLHDVFGYWTLSKGSVDNGETEESVAIRKAKEELGLDVKIVDKISDYSYVAHDPDLGKINRHVSYFLAEAEYITLSLGSSNGLDGAKWFELEEIKKLRLYKDMRSIIDGGVNMLSLQNKIN